MSINSWPTFMKAVIGNNSGNLSTSQISTTSGNSNPFQTVGAGISSTYSTVGYSSPQYVDGKEIIFSIDIEEIEEKINRMNLKDLEILSKHLERLTLLVQTATIEAV